MKILSFYTMNSTQGLRPLFSTLDAQKTLIYLKGLFVSFFCGCCVISKCHVSIVVGLKNQNLLSKTMFRRDTIHKEVTGYITLTLRTKPSYQI